MDKSDLIITIIIVLCIAAAVVAYGVTNDDNPVFSNLTSMGKSGDGGDNIGNNISANPNDSGNSVNNVAESGSSSSESSSSQGDSSNSNGGNSNNGNSNDGNSNDGSGGYSDWQQDYETGEYDEQGSPIYRSVASTSGGQNEPGVYEAYWSENGLISEEKIG